MDSEDEYHEAPTVLHVRRVRRGLITGAFLLCFFGWLYLLGNYPIAWAYFTGGMMAIALGLFTAKIVFQVQDFRKALIASPFLGAAWLGVFWILQRLTSG